MVKKIIWLLPFFCVLFIFASCSKHQTRGKPVTIYDRGPNAPTEEIVLENNFMEFRFTPETAGIVLRDKARGTEWHSSPLDAANDPGADVVTTQFMQSQFTLQYADVAGVGMTLYSGTHSVERGAYEYSMVDGGLEVRYTVGNLARTYIIPPAIQEDRFLVFLEKVDEANRSIITSSYRLYDISNLRPNDDRNTLLSLYPDLSRHNIYAMRDNTPEYMKEEIEGYLAEAGYTYDDYLDDIEHYPAAGGVERPAFNITLRYTLDGKSLVVTVPFDQIAYRSAYPVTQLDLLPFMGAGGINDEGYLLTPDGSGALLYFNNGRQNQIASNYIMYGWDEAMPRSVVVSENRAPYPAFGIQKNGAALLCVIEDGASYANIRADVSGRNCSYNSIYARFDMVHGAVMDISGRSDRPVYLYEAGLPQDERITMRLTLCEDDGYVGMAKEYRSWLLKKYPVLGSNNQKETGVPVALEIVGAVTKTQHRLGIPFALPLKLTSYKEAEEMINNFAALGWKNVRVKLNGWFNRSVDHSLPKNVKLIGELGSKKEFEGLTSAAKNNGYELYPEADFMYMRDRRTFDGFNLYRDAARYANRKRIEKYPYSFVWYGERIRWGKLSYIARPIYTMGLIDTFIQKTASLGLNNVAFRSMGSRLAGDYNEKRLISREASMKMRQEKFTELNNAGVNMLFNAGYAYAVPWASFITDMVLSDQGFGITDTSVPFYQIALHGLVPFTGPAINLAEDYTLNLLKTIESGAGLYFSFMSEETAVLQETKFRQFYANEYGKWAGDANTLYRQFTDNFAGLYSQAIVDHVILAPDVTVTVYEDGTRVIVNRSDNTWENNGVVIAAYNYAVLR